MTVPASAGRTSTDVTAGCVPTNSSVSLSSHVRADCARSRADTATDVWSSIRGVRTLTANVAAVVCPAAVRVSGHMTRRASALTAVSAAAAGSPR